MKARYQTYSVSQVENQIDAAVQRELTRYKDEIYDKVTWDVFKQAIAVCFTALEWMGWREKRLKAFRKQVEEVCHVMLTGVMGKEVTTRDALQHLKDAYGIDINDSIYDDQKETESEAQDGW